MTTTIRRATGAAISALALTLAGLTAPATAQSVTPTTWTMIEEEGFYPTLFLTRPGESEPIDDASGEVVFELHVKQRVDRYLDLMRIDEFPRVRSLSYSDEWIGFPSISEGDPELEVVQVLHNVADRLGEYGEYGWTATYGGDDRYGPATVTEMITIAPPAGKVVPISALSASPTSASPEGSVTVQLDPAINGSGLLDCAPLALLQDNPEVRNLDPVTPVTISNGQAAGRCELGETSEPHVAIFRLESGDDHTGSFQVLVFIPADGGTTAGIDPTIALAPGQQVTVTADDLVPNTTYDVVIESTPTTVGQLTTDGSGSGAAVVELPNDLTDGPHDLVLRLGGTDAVRKNFMLSTMSDPSAPATISIGDGSPSDPDDPTIPSGSLGSLTGS